MASERTVSRLSLYRRLLNGLLAEGVQNVYSHDLARLAGSTPAQVRRDLMAVGCQGVPTRGYSVPQLAESIGSFLDHPQGESVALVGIGNLGWAILRYFSGRRPKLSVIAAFDKDLRKVTRHIPGCRCYLMMDLEKVMAEEGIQLGIITVPSEEAQTVADRLVQTGVRGLLNFAPVRLRVPSHVFVENMDFTSSLEKVAFFARADGRAREAINPTAAALKSTKPSAGIRRR